MKAQALWIHHCVFLDYLFLKMETINDACQQSLRVCATSSVCFPPQTPSRKVSRIPNVAKRCVSFPIAVDFHQIYTTEAEALKGSNLNGTGQKPHMGVSEDKRGVMLIEDKDRSISLLKQLCGETASLSTHCRCRQRHSRKQEIEKVHKGYTN